MTKSIVFLLLLLGGTRATAQFAITNVNDSTGEFAFPLLKSSRLPEVAKEINKSLQIAELGSVIAHNSKDPLAPLKNEDEYSYSIICNNDRVFSLEISTGHNGAGSHFQFRNYSFDARKGNLIDPSVIFSPAGQVKVRQALYKVWKETIKANLNDSNFKEDYAACMAEANKITELPFSRMAVGEKTVQLWGGSCLDGSSWMADKTLGPHSIPYEQLLAMLTPYGLSLFVGAPKNAGALQQALIKGKIDGKYEFTLTFAEGETFGPIKGIIVYDKINTPIQLSGKMTNSQVRFNELDPSNKALSEIDCSWDGSKLKGTFKNLKTGKEMSFVGAKM